MVNTVTELADALEREGKKTLEFFKTLTPEQMKYQIYADGQAWKVHDLLAHFAEVEGSILALVRQIVRGGRGVAEDFDIERWNARHTTEMAQREDSDLLEEFSRRRAATVQLVRGLQPEDLEKRGRHPALGETEVNRMLRTMYIHVQGHIHDIRKALKPRRHRPEVGYPRGILPHF